MKTTFVPFRGVQTSLNVGSKTGRDDIGGARETTNAEWFGASWAQPGEISGTISHRKGWPQDSDVLLTSEKGTLTFNSKDVRWERTTERFSSTFCTKCWQALGQRYLIKVDFLIWGVQRQTSSGHSSKEQDRLLMSITWNQESQRRHTASLIWRRDGDPPVAYIYFENEKQLLLPPIQDAAGHGLVNRSAYRCDSLPEWRGTFHKSGLVLWLVGEMQKPEGTQEVWVFSCRVYTAFRWGPRSAPAVITEEKKSGNWLVE